MIANVQAIFDKAGTVAGHAFHNDVKMLRGVDFSDIEIRDTQLLPEYRRHARLYDPVLKDVSAAVLGQRIQGGKDGHSSVEDARATMKLYLRCIDDFETLQGRRSITAGSGYSPIVLRTVGFAPGYLVAMLMIAEFAMGRTFNYRNSTCYHSL